jgi:hypothetical protein
MNPTDFAVVVGINRYEKLMPLQGAVRDAEDFRAWLLKEPPGGAGLLPEHVYPQCKFKEDGTEPRVHQLEDAFKALLKLSDNAEKRIGRRLYIFLSGHGVGEDNVDDTSLLAVDASTNDAVRLVGALWANVFMKSGLFREIVLFMDCCREVRGWTLRQTNLTINLPPDPGAQVLRCYGYATGYGLLAREHNWDTPIYRGVFTRALLEGLAGDAEENGVITSLSLRTFLSKRMLEIRKPNTEQCPMFSVCEPIEFARDVPQVRVPVDVELVTDPAAGFLVLSGIGLDSLDVPREHLGGNNYRVSLVPGRKYGFAIPTGDPEVMGRMVKKTVLKDQVNHVTL